VILASREDPGRSARQSALNKRDPLAATVRRAATVTPLERIAAVVAAPANPWWQSSLKELAHRNLFVQPVSLRRPRYFSFRQTMSSTMMR
jgi:hypothetical protein